MSFPRGLWAQIASMKPLERVNREIKRRSDVIRTATSSNDGISIGEDALMLETN